MITRFTVSLQYNTYYEKIYTILFILIKLYNFGIIFQRIFTPHKISYVVSYNNYCFIFKITCIIERIKQIDL